jgi:sec-independent protein translocase protein TatA
MPSWIGPWEIAIVLVLALLIFGPKKLPDLGSSLGRSITGFKRGLKETKDDVQSAIKEDVTVDGAEATTEVRAEATTTTAAPPAAATATPVVTPTEGAKV